MLQGYIENFVSLQSKYFDILDISKDLSDFKTYVNVSVTQPTVIY
jgi:hypothetical protein